VIESRQRKKGMTFRVKRLEGRLTGTFRCEDAARLQDALWGRWGDAIPLLADCEVAVPADLLARLVNRATSELSPGLLTQLLVKHPAREVLVDRRLDALTLGEHLATFLEDWKLDNLPGRRGVPKAKKTETQITDALNRFIYKLTYERDHRGWRVKDKDGNYIVIGGWGEDAIAWVPLDQINAKLLLALDKEVKAAGVGSEVWRKTLNFIQQALDYAVLEGFLPMNPMRLIPKPPQSGPKKVRKAFLPDVVEAIRADFLLLDELARSHIRGSGPHEALSGIPVPEIVGFGAWAADLVEALAYSGCRPGELFAAAGRHLDGERLTVERRGVNGTIVDGTKSPAYPDKRVYLLGLLPESLASRAAESAELLFAYPGSGRQITEGEYRRFVRHYFGPIARLNGLGVESDDPYALRHVYASLRVAAHHPVPDIEASMGTSLVKQTYASVYEEYEGKEALDISKTVAQAREQATALLDAKIRAARHGAQR
jgi:integrase